jgi:hypothetical protein
MVAETAWRLLLTFSEWPYPLGRLADPGLSDECKLQLAQQFIDAFLCCLDENFGAKLKGVHIRPEDLLGDSELMSLLELWVKCSRICNMHLERMLASVRKAAPGKCPNSERMCAAGLLRQTLAEHTRAGGLHPAAATRKDLVSEGVPLLSNVQAAVAMPSKARGHISYSKKQVAEARALKAGPLTKEELTAVQRSAMNRWRALPPGVGRYFLRC